MYGYARIEEEYTFLSRRLTLYPNQHDPAVDYEQINLMTSLRSTYDRIWEDAVVALLNRCEKHGLDGFYFEDELYEVPKKVVAPPKEPKEPKAQRPKHNRIRRI